ncbi:hypothetical protein [Planctomicrobium sp. SH664]|uniref:hypothetical protein n=1 Tax=Planctomicrobium sp. SH664 TaxID=3448125 RepID=UPI003F5CB83E
MKELSITLVVGLLALAQLSGCSNGSPQTHVLSDEPETQRVGDVASTPQSQPEPAPGKEDISSPDLAKASGETIPEKPAPQAAAPPEEVAREAPAAVVTPAESTPAMSTSQETPAPPAEASSSGPDTGLRVLVPTREFSEEKAAKALRVNFDDIDLLRVINMEKVVPEAVDLMPDWLKGLNGKRIILRGWMYPPARAEGLGGFIFVRDNGVCCFGPNAKIYDKIGVRLAAGKTTRFIEGHSFDVIGTFEIEADFSDPDNSWLYFLHDAQVIDK